jgi:hypothetical protein
MTAPPRVPWSCTNTNRQVRRRDAWQVIKVVQGVV